MICDILGTKFDYKPYKDGLYKDKMDIRILSNPSFIRVFKRDKTNDFIATMRNIVNPLHKFEENTVWGVSGETGTGKSIAIMSLVKIILRKRGVWQLFCFTDKQVLDLASEFERDIFLVRDEDIKRAVYGEGSMRTQMQLEVLGETVRKAGLSLVFISSRPTPYDIAKYYLETVDMDIDNRITRLALKEPVTQQYIGAIYVPIIPNIDPDWIQYSKMKDAFIERMKRGEIADTKENLNNLVKEVLDKCDLETYRNKGERKTFIMSCYPNFTSGEIKTLSTLLEIRLRQQRQDDAPEM
jgi:ABC-type dipeptide/oligopeptide/nickel transport system ATPase component